MTQKLKGVVYINGKYLDTANAKISVLDHGFLYGDSIYETFRTYGGYSLQLHDHIKRLFRSARGIQLKIPMSLDDIRKEVMRTSKKYWDKYGPMDDLYVRIIISRGFGDIGFDPKLCPKATIIIVTKPYTDPPKHKYDDGIHIAVVPVIRNLPKSINPNIKSGNYLNNLLAYLEAKNVNADDAVMLNNDGYVTELTTSNIFIVKDAVILTPSLKCGILEGLTRSLILDIARQNHLKLKETEITKRELLNADECFLSSSLRRILPITMCDGKKMGPGSVGPITQTLITLFEQALIQCIKKEYTLSKFYLSF